MISFIFILIKPFSDTLCPIVIEIWMREMVSSSVKKMIRRLAVLDSVSNRQTGSPKPRLFTSSVWPQSLDSTKLTAPVDLQEIDNFMTPMNWGVFILFLHSFTNVYPQAVHTITTTGLYLTMKRVISVCLSCLSRELFIWWTSHVMGVTEDPRKCCAECCLEVKC